MIKAVCTNKICTTGDIGMLFNQVFFALLICIYLICRIINYTVFHVFILYSYRYNLTVGKLKYIAYKIH